jgi:hypothetical protein
MEYAIGAILGAVICPFASVVGFDKERGFYPVVLIVIEGYYLLFATMAKSTDALLTETIPLFLFAGLALHGGFDFIRHAIIPNPGVPAWWPGFCLAIDVAMAGYLAVLIRVRKDSQTA